MKNKVKKLLAIMLSLSLIITTVLSVPQITAGAETYGDFEYSLNYNNTEVSITKYNGPGGDVVIPKLIGNKPVKEIADNAFEGCTGLTSIAIPDSVTSIGNWAFGNCTGLTSVTIPNSVTSIGVWAFEDCTKLSTITLSSSVTDIGFNAFYNTEYYNDSNNWENDVLYIDNCLIIAKETITDSYDIKDGTRLIGDWAFDGCAGLTSITIPNSVTSIGDLAFYVCTGLTCVTIPDSVTSIGDEAFDGCTGLTSITIGNGVTSIGEFAFSHCTGLTSITIPDNVTSIGEYAFYVCTGLTSITIPNSVTSIGDHTFEYCTGLTGVTIPNSVTSIGVGAFSYTGYYNDSSNWENGVLYIGNCLIEAKDTITGNYTVKDGAWLIADTAFYDCTELTNITIPDSVTSIGKYAFEGCTGLTSITTPDSVTSIGGGAFEGCTGLTSINIPNSVTSIGYDAFWGCTGLKTVRYFGTPEEFEALVTEYDNDWLLDLEIIYMQQLKTDGVVLTAEKGVLQEGTVLNAEKIESDLEQIIEQLPNEYDVKSIVVYELNLTKDGQNVNFDRTVTVCVPLPEGISPNKCRVLYMDDNGNVTDMNAVYKDGAMVFETTHFSTYILVEENSVLSGDLDGNEEITDADAVYLLMYTFFPDDYPINQDCDFDVDGQVTDADAVYLLMYTFFPEDYPIA